MSEAAGRRPLVVGLDARPALFGRTGFGRVVRESIAALRRRDDVELKLYGAALRRPRADCRLEGARTPPLPARLQRLLAGAGFGVETLLGPLDVFHHTDLVFAPVRRAPEVLTLYDLVFLQDASWHEPGFAERLLPRVVRRVQAARALLMSSSRVVDLAVEHLAVDPDRCVVAPFGADHVDPEPQPDDERHLRFVLQSCALSPELHGPLVLVPGTREPRKNQLAVIEAFLAARQGTGAQLVLAGPKGWGCAALERRLLELRGRGEGVGAAGEVTEEQMTALLRRADVVAYPSLAEGFGLPVVEAMRCGKAVLTSRDTPMADVGGEAVRLVDPRDREQLRDALRVLLTLPHLREELGAAAREQVAPLTWDAHAEALRELYERGAHDRP